MSRSAPPLLWFPLGLVVLSALGAALLAHPALTVADPRDLEFYWTRHAWMSAFNALSAACGVGLLTADFDKGFSDAGRVALSAIGLIGAGMHVAAGFCLWRRMRGAAPGSAPRLGLVLAAFVGVQVVIASVCVAVERAEGSPSGTLRAVFRGLAAGASLGWSDAQLSRAARAALAGASFLASLGWPVWLLWHRRVRATLRPAALAGTLGAYACFLAVSALLLTLFDAPRRGSTRLDLPPPTVEPLARRFGDSLARVAAAGGAGIDLPLSRGADRSDGAQLVLATVIVVGGLGGSAGGGMRGSVALLVLGAAVALFRRSAPTSDLRPAARAGISVTRAAAAVALALASLTLVVALGLLVIDARVGSPFQPPATLADALLEAASATGGAGLSSGLTATLTGPHLSSGMFSPVDRYQYGMAWLMLAMLAGRVLPVWILARLLAPGSAPHAATPLL